MNSFILHPATNLKVERFLDHPAHAVLLVAPAGSGKTTLARYLAAKLLGKEEASLEKYPYLRTVGPEDGRAIPIDTIRQLQQSLTLKIPGTDGIRRIVIIENAQSLTVEAQNALLKTLEEPPLDTIIIMTATSTEALLPTIQSRVSMLHIVPPSPDQISSHYLQSGFKSIVLDKAMMLAGNLPGLTHALLIDERNHPLFAATEEARGLLQATLYERLAKVDTLSKQKDVCADVLLILNQMARMALMRNPQADGKAAERWRRVMKNAYEAGEQLRRNTNTKLVMTNLMLEI